MSFRKTLTHRLYNNISKMSPKAITPPNPAKATLRRDLLSSSESGKKGFFRRFLQKRAIVQSAISSEISSVLIGERLMRRLKDMNMNRERVRLEGLYPPEMEKKPEPPEEISIDDAKKLIRVSQLEMLKATLREVPTSCVSYADFLEICVASSNPEEGLGFAKMLDDSGSVIVLGNVVFLRPEQVTKAIEGLIPLSILQPNDTKRKELENMEKEKAEIDKEAESLVRRELWAGLGFMVVQTAGFMRLTFWELSWDVMEPVCFYVTSVYFMAGYSFFLRTSKDPSFEGFFESRFTAKQKRLMKKKKFDVQRFNELRRTCYLFSSEPPSTNTRSLDASDRAILGALHP